MILFDFLIALFVAMIVSLLFSKLFRRYGPWPGFFTFFFIIFLVALAGGLWITPFGPKIGAIYWLPFLISAIIFALLLAAIPTKPRPRKKEIEIKPDEQIKVEKDVNLFLWGFVILLFLAIVIRYVQILA
jgi:hypothetical protein